MVAILYRANALNSSKEQRCCNGDSWSAKLHDYSKETSSPLLACLTCTLQIYKHASLVLHPMTQKPNHSWETGEHGAAPNQNSTWMNRKRA